MLSTSKKKMSSSSIPQFWFIIFIVIVGWSRYLPLTFPELFNFTPVLALFFVSGAFLQGHLSWIGPLLAVFVSDLFLNPNYGVNLLEPFTLISIGSYLGIFFIGKSLRNKLKPFSLLAGAVTSALLFHAITCGFAWFINPAYPKTLAGLWQAQFLGEPGYAPAYLFLRNSIVSTILFSSFFSFLYLKNKNNKIMFGNSSQAPKTQQSL